jgi:hypothetical protein
MKFTFQNTAAVGLIVAITISILGSFTRKADLKTLFGIQKINKPPKAVAGPDKTIVLPDQMYFTISGAASVDPEGDLSLATSKWEKISGSPLIFMSQSMGSADITLVDTGKYVFEFTAKDRWGLWSKDTVVITVKWADN